MRWSYLSFRYHLLFYIVFLFCYLIGLYSLLIVLTVTYLLMSFFYRKKSYLKEIEDPCLQKCFSSPAHGEILDVSKDDQQTLIRLKTSWLKRGDLVMPMNGEVVNLQEDPLWVEFETPKKNLFSMKIIGRKIVRRRPFYLLTGDRARNGASIGFMLFGGELLLKLGENYTIMVNRSDVVKAGSTPLAILNE